MQPIFARITKVDEQTRTVTGRAAQEVVDRDNEIFDYKTSKPEFMKWSAEVSSDTGGKSLGNVRSMHGNVAAGKITDINFNDVEKAIDISAKIVDDNEWEKVLEGVHTGFSIGGRYAKKWAEPINGKMIQRYTAVPSEISIVDRPCCPTAKFFSVHKRDGSVEKREHPTYEDFDDDVEVSIDDKGNIVRKLELNADGTLGFAKGGPGSGPHGGNGKAREASNEAAAKSVKANNSGKAKDHMLAAAAHNRAAAEHSYVWDKSHDEESKQLVDHHQDMADRHTEKQYAAYKAGKK